MFSTVCLPTGGSIEANLTIMNSTKLKKCRACGKNFPSEAHLRQHYKTHKTLIGNKFQCPQCDKTFVRMSQLGQHIDRKHQVAREIEDVEETNADLPTFPQVSISDKEITEMKHTYMDIVQTSYPDEPLAVQKYGESSSVIFDNRIIGSNNSKVSDCCVVKTFIPSATETC